MNWSRLAQGQKRLLIAVGILVLVLILVSLNNRRQAGANILPSGAPGLDSGGFGTVAVSFNTGEAAFADFVDPSGGGVVAQTNADGEVTVSLTPGCYTATFTATANEKTKTIELAIGGATDCPEGAEVVEKANTSQPIVVTMN